MNELKIGTWYKIPKYNGYEIQFTNEQQRINSYPVFLHEKYHVFFWLRSWKNFKKYPNGYVLPYTHGTSYYYELSDISNNRMKVSIADIVKMIQNSDYESTTTHNTKNIGSRNNVKFRTNKSNIGLGDLLKQNSLIKGSDS